MMLEPAGKITLLTGRNGCGKTTLLRKFCKEPDVVDLWKVALPEKPSMLDELGITTRGGRALDWCDRFMKRLHAVLETSPEAIIVCDDVGEGLEAQLAFRLILWASKRIEQDGQHPVLFTSSQREVLNHIPLNQWRILKDGTFLNGDDPMLDDFKYTGLNNCDVFSYLEDGLLLEDDDEQP